MGLFSSLFGSNQEFGKEARHIAEKELGVPSSYYNHMVLNNMAGVKETAVHLRDNDNDFRNSSWPRLLALVIYGEFHQDCEQWHYGIPIAEQLFTSIGVAPEIIAIELRRDAREVLYGSL